MCHTSGLGENPDGELSDNCAPLRMPLDEAVRFTPTRHLQFDTRARAGATAMEFRHAWPHYRKVSGEVHHYIASRILKPLGMTDTFFLLRLPIRDRIALSNKHATGKLCGRADELLGRRSQPSIRGRALSRPSTALFHRRPTWWKFYQMLLLAAAYRATAFFPAQTIFGRHDARLHAAG